MMTMRLKRFFSAFCAIIVLVACAFTSVELFCENNLNIKTYSRTISSEERAHIYDGYDWNFVVLSNDECEYRLYYDLQDDGIHIMGICLNEFEEIESESQAIEDENGVITVIPPTTTTINEVSGIIEIPSTINGIDVVSIDKYLGYWDDVTEFIIPNTVTYIGSYAFSNNYQLTTITIPDSVTYIDSFAFSDNKNLTTITIPNSVTYMASNALSGDSNLREIYYDGTWEEWDLLGVDLPDSTILLYFYVPETDMTETSVINTETSMTTNTETSMTTNTETPMTTQAWTETYMTEILSSEVWESEECEVVTETTTATGTYDVSTDTTATTDTTSGIVIEAPDESELYVGNQFQLSIQGDYTERLFWGSLNASVATVDSLGVVTITGNGTVTILVMNENAVIYDSITFTVDSTSITTQTTETTTETYDVSTDTTTTTETTSGIVIEAPDESELYVGNQFQLSVQGDYTGALFWASSDASVATVDSSGVVTIIGNGTVTLLVMDENAVTYSITFTIDSTSTTSGIVIEAPDESELYVGNQFQLSVQGDYTGALFWASSDASVATVDSSGIVTITGNGTVTLLVMDENAVTYSITFTIDSAMELGDIDGNDQITPTDAYICLVVYANIQLGLNTGMSSEQLAAADVNGDGAVDTMDSYYMLCYYAEVQLRGVATWSEILSR